MEIQNQASFLGAIVGDIAGSRFEWCNIKSKDLTLLVGRGEDVDECCFTDDTVMTVAIVEAILKRICCRLCHIHRRFFFIK